MPYPMIIQRKRNQGKCSNERRITLASNPGKVFERFINDRVKKEVQPTDAQSGGIPGSATCNHLIILDQTIQEIRNDKKTAYVIFPDVQKACNKAWFDGILHAIHPNGVKGKNCQWSKNKTHNSEPESTLDTDWQEKLKKYQRQH